MKKLLLILLLPLSASAQFSAVAPVAYTAITANNEMGFLDPTTDDEDAPVTRNFVYTDTADFFAQGGSIPIEFLEAPMLHTRDADRNSAGGGTVVSFTVDQVVQTCVWHDDAEVVKPAWLASSGYLESIHDIDWSGGVMSAFCQKDQTGTVNLGGNCPAGGCVSAPTMYFATSAPPRRWVPPSSGGGPAPDNGDYSFTASSSTQDESTSVSDFLCQRTDGSDGAVSVDITDLGTGSATSGVEYDAITDTTCSWADAETGTKDPLEITVNALTQNETVDLGFTTVVGGISAGSPVTHTITLTETGSPPAAADFTVDQDDGACDNGGPGSVSVPWCSFAPANGAAGGSTIEVVGPSTYVGAPIIDPTNSGSMGDPTIWRPIGGTVTLQDGNGTHAFRCDVDWLTIGRSASGNFAFHIDGEGQPVRGSTNAGQDIDKIGFITGDNCDIDMTHGGPNQFTSGYSGVEICGADVTRLVLQSGGHGNPFHGSGEWGDTIQSDDECPTTGKILIENSSLIHGGHNLWITENMSTGGFFRNIYHYCWWWDNGSGHGVTGYSETDGKRCASLQDFATHVFVEYTVWVGSGDSAIKNNETQLAFNGTDNVARWSLFIDSEGEGIWSPANNTNGAVTGVYIAHNSFYQSDQAAVRLSSLARDLDGPFVIVNNAFLETENNGGATPTPILIQCGSDDSPSDFRIEGNWFEDKSVQRIDIDSNCGGLGEQTVATYEANGVWDDFILNNIDGGVAPFVNAAVDAADVAEGMADFTPAMSSALIGAAVALSTATSGQTSSTTLDLADSVYWPNGLNGFPAPTAGPDGGAGCYRIRKITSPTWTACVDANNLSLNRITLGSTQDWNSGDEFGYVNTDIGAVDN